jgi:hypothetical protein
MEFSAFCCGIIPYNPLALWVAACDLQQRPRSEEQSGDGRPVGHAQVRGKLPPVVVVTDKGCVAHGAMLLNALREGKENRRLGNREL